MSLDCDAFIELLNKKGLEEIIKNNLLPLKESKKPWSVKEIFHECVIKEKI